MEDWEQTLELLLRRGWGYGFAKCLDGETGEAVYLVNLGRGTRRLSVTGSSLHDAVIAISRLAEAEDGRALSDYDPTHLPVQERARSLRYFQGGLPASGLAA